MKRTEFVFYSKEQPDKNAHLAVGNDEIVTSTGPPYNYGISSGKYGNVINGPVSFFTDLQNINFLGIFELNEALTLCIPSTASKPIPVLKPRNIGALTKGLQDLIAEALDILG